MTTLLFNPVTIFGLLFFVFGIKNLHKRHYPSAMIYLTLSFCIILGGLLIMKKIATSHGQMPIVDEQTNEETSNQ